MIARSLFLGVICFFRNSNSRATSKYFFPDYFLSDRKNNPQRNHGMHEMPSGSSYQGIRERICFKK